MVQTYVRRAYFLAVQLTTRIFSMYNVTIYNITYLQHTYQKPIKTTGEHKVIQISSTLQ